MHALPPLWGLRDPEGAGPEVEAGSEPFHTSDEAEDCQNRSGGSCVQGPGMPVLPHSLSLLGVEMPQLG